MQENNEKYFAFSMNPALHNAEIAFQTLVFVKDASLYFTNPSHERRRREIVITSAKHEAERSEIALLKVRAPYKKLNSKP